MILQIRGVNGSGKSTLVRNWMHQSKIKWVKRYTHGRSKPWYYSDPDGKIAVLGHYEGLDCGGCDTLSGGANVAVALVHQIPYAHPGIRHIICEGILLSEDERWTTELHQICTGETENNSPLKGNEVRVMFIRASCQWCVDNVFRRQRNKNKRTGKNREIKFNVPKLERRYEYLERTYHKLVRNGVPTWYARPSMIAQCMNDWLV